MQPVLNTLRRTLATPAALIVCLATMALAWLAALLAEGTLGAGERLAGEVRLASALFAALLTLSLAEPLQVLGEARGGLLALRRARGGGFALPQRCLGLLLATLPAAGLASLAAGGWPASPLSLLLDLLVLCAAALCLGAFLERGLLVTALWLLLVAGALRPWLGESVSGESLLVAWLPQLGVMSGLFGSLKALLWSAGALLLAESRLRAAAAHGG
ncbi:MAG: hypothetical protein ACT4PU_11050 [Planctomycetota bacterium]